MELSMRIINAKGENFLSYKEFNYDYTAQGLTLIEGYDEDLDVNTGAGKSTFLDIICYGLFGATSKKLKADDVINWHSKKNLSVQLTFEDSGQRYVVHRYRKHKEHENDFYIEYNGEKMRGKDARETQKMLEEIIGLSMEIFTKSVYFGQFDEVDKFLSATDKQKKELIGTICDLSSYDDMFDAVKEKIKGNDEIIADLMTKRSPEQTKLDLFEAQVRGGEDSLKSWDSKNAENILVVKSNILEWDKDKKSSIKKLESENDEWAGDHKKRQAEAQAKMDSWQGGIDEQKAEIDSAIAGFDKTVKEIRQKYVDTKAKLDEKETLQAEFKKSDDELARYANIDDQMGRINQAINIEDYKMNELREKIVKEQEKAKDGGGDCPFCHQPVSPEHLKKHIDQLIAEGLVFKEAREKLQSELADLAKDYEGKEPHRLKHLEIVEKIKDLDKVEFELKNLESEGKNLKNSIESRNREKQGLANQVNPYEAQIEALKREKNWGVETLEKLIETSNPHDSELEKLELEVNPHKDGIKKLKADKKKAKSEIKKFDLALGVQEDSKKLGLFWKEALGTYIRSFLMDSFLDQLNTQANDYLETLFNGVLKVELSAVTEGKKAVKEKISQKIYNGNIECSYDSLSGGERCRVCLAINLALSDITSKTLGKSVSILMLDEIFTGLDSAGKSQTMKLLKELEPRFETIFVIDHTEEFKSLFTNDIMIRKKGGTSTIT